MFIKKVIIPAAGRGSRLNNLTLTQGKELLPIVNKPVIDFSVDEAIEAGLEQICIVTSEGKLNSLKAHLANKPAEITYLIQRHPLGLGHAIYLTRDWLSGENFAVILPDDLYFGDSVISRMTDFAEKSRSSSLAVFPVDPINSINYGIPIISGEFNGFDPVGINGIAEKPKVFNENYKYAVMGRYVLTNDIWNYLDGKTTSPDGEIQLTRALNLMSLDGKLSAFLANHRRIDVGSEKGWLEANIYAGSKIYGEDFIKNSI